MMYPIEQIAMNSTFYSQSKLIALQLILQNKILLGQECIKFFPNFFDKLNVQNQSIIYMTQMRAYVHSKKSVGAMLWISSFGEDDLMETIAFEDVPIQLLHCQSKCLDQMCIDIINENNVKFNYEVSIPNCQLKDGDIVSERKAISLKINDELCTLFRYTVNLRRRTDKTADVYTIIVERYCPNNEFKTVHNFISCPGYLTVLTIQHSERNIKNPTNEIIKKDVYYFNENYKLIFKHIQSNENDDHKLEYSFY